MSETAYRLIVMRRALARSDRELFGQRARYEAVQQRVASQLIAGDYTSEFRAPDTRDAATLDLLDQAHRAAQAARFAA